MSSIKNIVITAFFIVFSSINLLAQSNEPAKLQALNISASLDMVAPYAVDNPDRSLLSARSAELLLYAPIDHIFDGAINIAGHNDNGEFSFDLHEGYLSSSKLIARSRFKVGKFLLGVGRLNNFHQHDWPFTSAPKVFREFFSPGVETALQSEGAADSGIEYSWLLPLGFYVDLTMGVTNGYCFGHCHTQGSKPPYPLFYIHPVTFLDFENGKGLLLGLSYLNRKDYTSLKTELFGLDLTYKSREGKRLTFFVQSEIFYQAQSAPGVEKTDKAGFYFFPQYGIDESLFIGLRMDGYSQLNLKFQNGDKRSDFDYALVPTLSYKPSEFSTLRASYTYEIDTTQGAADIADRQFMVQFIYNLGAHPAHDF